MSDPRVSIIGERLKDVKRLIAVSGGKGGVGKSLVSSVLALALAKDGFRVGLFDLDFTSPSTHVILGVKDVQPREEMGIVPPVVHGLTYMSIVYYSGDLAAPLRGDDVSSALIELLSVVKWGSLDYLVLDLPPGIGDVTLDLVRLVSGIEFLIVTTSSLLAFETVKKLVGFLKDQGIPIIGVVENMKMNRSDLIKRETAKLGLAYLTDIPFDSKVEESVGNPEKLMITIFGREVKQIAEKIR